MNKDACLKSDARNTQVYLIGSIHYKLATNPKFTMQYLTELIRRIDPGVIGVEISPEHMNLDQAALHRLYSPEFPEIKRAFEATKTILPFNWMTLEQMEDRSAFLAGSAALKRALAAAPFKQGEKTFLRMLETAFDTVMDWGSAAEINSLAGDQLMYLKQQFELSIVTGTEFEEKWLYYSGYLNPTRISAIDHNIQKIIETQPGKKIVILTGALHRVHIIPFLQKNLPAVQLITEIPD